MSEPCGSISGSPLVIHSATAARDPGRLLDPDRGGGPEALDLRRLADDRVAVRGQREQAVDRELHARLLVADDLGEQLERILELRVEVVLGERQHRRRERRFGDRRDVVGVHEDRPVGVRADLELVAVLALVHVRVDVADDRVADRAPARARRSRTGPMSIIWWTAGVSGIEAPAIAAIRGLQTPHAMTTVSVSMSPRSVRTRVTRPSFVSMPVTSTPGADRQRAQVLRLPAHERPGLERVDDADARPVDATEDDRPR